jgi:hypothetical protein
MEVKDSVLRITEKQGNRVQVLGVKETRTGTQGLGIKESGGGLKPGQGSGITY